MAPQRLEREVTIMGEVIMALILPKGFNGLAWDACEQFLLGYDESNRAFTATFRPESGFIVSHWQDESSEMPTHYLRRSGYASPMYIRMDDFLAFGVGTEDPLRPRTFSAASHIVKVSKKKFGLNFGLIFWIKPDFKFILPDDDYHQALMGEGKKASAGK